MRYLLLFLLFSPVFAGLTIKDLKTQLKQGADEAELIPLIQKEGVSFDINLKSLKKMKRADFPDFLIDGLVELYGPHREPQTRLNMGSSAGFMSLETDYFSPYYRPGLGTYSYYSWPYSVYLLNAMGLWGFYSSMYGYYWNYGYGYWNYWYGGGSYYDGYGGSRVPGNRLSPKGFSNSQENRVKGTATRRGKSKARSAFSGSSSGSRSYSGSSSRTRGSSSSSSSRSSAVHK